MCAEACPQPQPQPQPQPPPRFEQVVAFFVFPFLEPSAVAMKSGERDAGSARRRRERRLRSWLRHERMTVAAGLSAQPFIRAVMGGREQYVGLRAQKSDSAAVVEEVEYETHAARPAPRPEVAGAVTVGYVAPETPSLAVVPVSDGRIDDAALQFFLQQPLLARAEEEEAREEAVVKELEEELFVRERLPQLVGELRGAGSEAHADLSRLEHAVVRWCLAKTKVTKWKEKKKKKKRRKPGSLFTCSS